jgi:Mannosylglycerate hydrolase MGH1-like glycoside hydrolase domain
MNDSPFLDHPKPSPERYDTHVTDEWVSANPFISRRPDPADLPVFSHSRETLPDPFWAGHPEVSDCYWRAWELAFGNLKQPTPENDFAANYCDTAFNGNLFMWDSAFVTCYGVYGRRAFNFQKTLDTFYRKQHPDGFICREISETDGGDTFPRFDPSSTGPNVLAWAEWNHFVKSGDRERLAAVFPPLVAYHHWLRKYRSWPDGSYWSSGWGTGMDNLPRLPGDEHPNFDHGHMSWVDATLQALLSAKVLLQMATLLGREAEVPDLGRELERLTLYVNQQLWNEEASFYFDRLAGGGLSSVKHIGAYWALLAGCVPVVRLPGFVAHLENPAEFKRAHRIPALSADHPAFSGSGGYWCGGVWAPTNYMVLKGLDENGQGGLAYEIARNHLEKVVQVFNAEDLRWEGAEQFRQYFHLADLKYDDQHTLWENYAPDEIKPGSHSKPGYVGWTGLPPIAVLLEDVFGLFPDALSNWLTWNVRLTEQHGVRRYPFGLHGQLDLICSPRNSRLDRPSIEIHSNIPLTLQVIWEGGAETVTIEKDR